MFYNESQAIKACEEDPSLIFELIKLDQKEIVEKLLTKKIVDINTTDQYGNDCMVRLLKHGDFDVVLSHINDESWDVNHQNYDGNTFMHILVTMSDKRVVEIMSKIKKNKRFMPNIKNNNGETILDKSISGNHFYTTIKVLQDARFNDIDIVSFKKLYETYIKSKDYGKYSKVDNLESILDSLEDKVLVPSVQKIVEYLIENLTEIKEQIFDNNLVIFDNFFRTVFIEDNA